MKKSSLAIIFANVIPLGGILFYDWGILNVLYLYWAESAIVGLYAVMKMFLADVDERGKLAIISFFIAVFIGFLFLHALIINKLFGHLGEVSFGLAFALIPSFIVLLLSHGYSFVTNYLDGKEMDLYKLKDLRMIPFKRVFLMQVVILCFAFGALVWGEFDIILVFVVVAKVLADLFSHSKEHSHQGLAETKSPSEF